MIHDLATHPRRFVTVPDLVRYSGVPRATVYWHIYYGKLPVRRFGASLRIETTAAREWVELHGQTPDVSTTPNILTHAPASTTAR